jgi:hypothetical protein
MEMLKKKQMYENKLIDIELWHFVLEVKDFNLTFTDTRNQRKYNCTVFNSWNKISDISKALLFTFKQHPWEACSESQVIKKIFGRNFTVDFTQNYSSDIAFYLRVDEKEDAIGLISEFFTKTDKLLLHNCAIEALSVQYDVSPKSIICNAYYKAGFFRKVEMYYRIHDKTVLQIIFGNDTGWSPYILTSYDGAWLPQRNHIWKHNNDLISLYNKLYDSIFNSKSMFNYNRISAIY